jgi:flagellar motor switch protein FliN
MAIDGMSPDEISLSDLEALGADLDAAIGNMTSSNVSAPPTMSFNTVAPAAPPPAVTSAPSVAPQRAKFAALAEEPRAEATPANIDILMDVSLKVSVELGRATLTVRETLNLSPGHVVELDKLAGDPVDVLVNGRLIARGEVVVVDDQFGVRITEIVSPRQRVEAMR